MMESRGNIKERNCPTRSHWSRRRRRWLVPTFKNWEQVESANKKERISFGLFRPKNPTVKLNPQKDLFPPAPHRTNVARSRNGRKIENCIFHFIKFACQNIKPVEWKACAAIGWSVWLVEWTTGLEQRSTRKEITCAARHPRIGGWVDHDMLVCVCGCVCSTTVKSLSKKSVSRGFKEMFDVLSKPRGTVCLAEAKSICVFR